MCATCGCSPVADLEHSARAGGDHPEHGHGHHDHDAHDHDHPHHHDHAPAPEAARLRRVAVEADLLARNDAVAAANRARLAETGVFAVNLVSSPGSGKTSLLVATIDRLADQVPVAVIEGDQTSDRDAARVRATGVPAVQINTGKGCHLDAGMVARAMDELPLDDGGILFVENVGNLVCPAAFDLGEAHKVVIFSTTEGEDKPLKYPDMFRAAGLMLLNKVDLVPHLDVDVDEAEANARLVNPGLRAMRTSARTGEGLTEWTAWLSRQAARAHLGAGAWSPRSSS